MHPHSAPPFSTDVKTKTLKVDRHKNAKNKKAKTDQNDKSSISTLLEIDMVGRVIETGRRPLIHNRIVSG